MWRGLAQTDGTDNNFADLREGKCVKMSIDEAERDVPDFTVIFSIIHVKESCIEIKVFGPLQRDAMLTLIDGVFCRTVRYLHAF